MNCITLFQPFTTLCLPCPVQTFWPVVRHLHRSFGSRRLSHLQESSMRQGLEPSSGTSWRQYLLPSDNRLRRTRERVLKVCCHRLLTLGNGHQVFCLDIEYHIKEQQHVEADKVEHRTIEMDCQITDEPLCP